MKNLKKPVSKRLTRKKKKKKVKLAAKIDE